MIHLPNERGFSTVELLISLFIAAAFIGTGFQLFSVVMKDGNNARLRAAAGTIASTKIQEHVNNVNSPCSPVPTTVVYAVPTSELPQSLATVSYSCPYGVSSKTTRIKVLVVYGTPQESVERSLDVTK